MKIALDLIILLVQYVLDRVASINVEFSILEPMLCTPYHILVAEMMKYAFCML